MYIYVIINSISRYYYYIIIIVLYIIISYYMSIWWNWSIFQWDLFVFSMCGQWGFHPVSWKPTIQKDGGNFRIFSGESSPPQNHKGGETVKSENKEAGSEWSGLNYVLFLGLFWRKDFTVLSTFSSVKCCQTASLEWCIPVLLGWVLCRVTPRQFLLPCQRLATRIGWIPILKKTCDSIQYPNINYELIMMVTVI